MEEAPSWFIESTLSSLPGILHDAFDRERLACSDIKVMATPRRIAAIVSDLDGRQGDESRQVIGPPVKIAVSEDGAFLPPAIKFAEKNHAAQKDLITVETPKGKYVAVNIHVEGRPAVEIIAELIPRVFSEKVLPHRKSMKWGEAAGPFVRPVHWLLVLLDGDVVPCSLFGVASDRLSRGHRFHSPAEISIAAPDEYEEKLMAACVVVDREKRRKMIRKQLLDAASAAGGALKENPELEEEVCNLVEWPVVVTGRFDEKFLDLPHEVTITVMAKHQRYFAVNDEQGGLMPLFLAVANMDPAIADDDEADARAAMTRGYERVLTARLEDGSFFFAEDGKKPLEQRLDALKDMVFQKSAGDFFMKSERLARLSRHISDYYLDVEPDEREAVIAKCERAALLCKADLASNMVFEFPELQGVMGGIYAQNDGADKDVAAGIAQHYLPSSASDPLPSSITGAVVSVADKIDSLMTFLALGKKPSATSDPLGMRRLCLGIIRILVQGEFGGNKLTFNLRGLAEFTLKQVETAITKTKKKKKIDDPVGFFMEFLEDRLKVYWKDRARADILDAVIACGIDDLRKTRMRLEALIAFQKSADFEHLAVAFKRAYRISRELGDERGEVNTDLFQQEEERELYDEVQSAKNEIDAAYRRDDFSLVYNHFSSLRHYIDKYFEYVFVNVEEEEIKINRLRMMKMIADLVEDSARLDFVQFERTR